MPHSEQCPSSLPLCSPSRPLLKGNIPMRGEGCLPTLLMSIPFCSMSQEASGSFLKDEASAIAWAAFQLGMTFWHSCMQGQR